MGDRSHCGATTGIGHYSESDDGYKWPNLASALELDYSVGGCSRYDDLVTAHPHCLDPSSWPKDTCHPAKLHRDCRENIADVHKKVSTLIPQAWPIVEEPLRLDWPSQMTDCDERKYHIPGYSGYVPRTQFGPKFGTFAITTHQGLNEFSAAQQGQAPSDCYECPPDPCWPPERGRLPRREPECHIGCGMMPRCS